MKVVALVGPTASGKTALSLSLCEQLNAEIVACDSRTIYRHMDIGTAKPSPKEQARVPHHMIDIIDPSEKYSASEYAQAAAEKVTAIAARGRLPMVVGGTGFYARALLEGLAIPKVKPAPELREELRNLAEQEGNAVLHARLADIDPVTAGRLNANDIFRVVRALEVSIVSGRPFSQVAQRVDPPYDVLWIGLTANDRTFLHKTIAARFESQIQAGLVEEVKGLLERFGPCPSIMNTINYKELAHSILADADLSQAKAECIKHNRQLARRQLIWFRANHRITWFAIDTGTHGDIHCRIASFIDSQFALK